MPKATSLLDGTARAPYADLVERLAHLRERTARFRRVALHVHSPDSHDWPRPGSDLALNDRSRFAGSDGPSQFADELHKHLDLVAITDHMRCDFASRVSRQTGTCGDFAVLPGMEVNFRPEAALGCARIHLLTILPAGSTPETFARLFEGLTSIPDDGHRTGREEVTGIPLRDWVRRVHRQGGLCIAAHVENDQGIRCRFRQTAREVLQLFTDGDPKDIEREYQVGENFKEYLFDSGIDAVEITRSADGPHYRWVSDLDGQRRSISTVLTFDAHSIEQFARPDRTTHIKMTQLGISALRDAFLFPDTRIRFAEALSCPPTSRVLGVQIVGGSGSFFEDVTIAFAENLTCLIGARGSGKSTLVESLRYVFGYNRTLGELEKLEAPIREMQRANLADSLIRVPYLTAAGETRILEATFDAKADYTTRVYTPEGDFVDVADVEASNEYPLRLFGWSEIETLGRDPARQRDLLDRLVAELPAALRKRDSCRAELRRNRAAVDKAVRDLQEAFRDSGGEISRYREYKADFDKLNTDEVQSLFSTIDVAQVKRRLLAQVRANVDTLIEQLGDPSRFSVRGDDVESILAQADQALRDWWLAEEVPRLALLNAEQDVQKSVGEAVERLRSFALLVDQHGAELDAQIAEVERELRESFAADTSMQRIADLRSNANRRLTHVTSLRETYSKHWDVLQKLLADRDELLAQLVAAQNEIAGIRSRHANSIKETLNRFLPDGMRVEIQFTAGADTVQFTKSVNSCVAGASRYKARNLAQVVAKHYTPIGFARMIRRGELDGLRGKDALIGGVHCEFTEDDVAKIGAVTSPFEHHDHADVPVLAEDAKRLQSLLDLEEVPWDDWETILLNGRPVNEMSPGQRSSAMLPLIALAENTPLVIDQPEDNLDKRLIGTVLANVLAQLKEKRQIVVCTHDPNILVGGDAEQVVVLDAISDCKAIVSRHGSIDNDDIVQTVIDLLEGGKEAFEARHRRYREHVT